jgi:hypothetical protein
MNALLRYRTALFITIGTVLASLGIAGFVLEPGIGTATLGSTLLALFGFDFLIAALWKARYAVARSLPVQRVILLGSRVSPLTGNGRTTVGLEPSLREALPDLLRLKR